MTDRKCYYCGQNCPQNEEYACDGYLGDVDNLYAETVHDSKCPATDGFGCRCVEPTEGEAK